MKKIQKALIIIIAILLSELTLFNARYYINKKSGLENEIIVLKRDNLTSYYYEDFTFNKIYTIKLNTKIKGIKLNLIQNNNNKEIIITPKFKDESSKYQEKELETFTYLPSFKNREYIVLNSQEKCTELQFEMKSKGNFHIQSIELNTWYFEFNWLRVCCLILISLFIIYKKEINNYFEKNPKSKKVIYISFIAVSTISLIYYSYGSGELYEKSSWEAEVVIKDIYRELTQSIMHGKLTLDYPEEEKQVLSNYQNYQDYSERIKLGKSYLHDAAFYNGNYYCYYGIIPVVTVLLPIALTTGIYCYSNVICIIYSVLVMIILLKIYLKLLEKFKIKFSFLLEFVGYICLLLTMELLLLWAYPSFYQAVDLCGIFWSLFALWQIMKLENGEKTKLKLILIGLSYGCMVLTRSTYVFYILPIIIAIWKYLVQNKRIIWKNVVVFAIPIVIMAIFQMWYNYARFDNIFEFGQFHQLTVNDTSTLELEPEIAIDGIFSFLFNPPIITRHFPFIGYNSAGVNTGNEIYTADVFGVFWHPFLLILLTGISRIKNNKNSKKLGIYTVISWIITITLMVISTCYAGVIQRYLTFILPSLTLLALVYWLLYITESKNEEAKKDRIKIFKIVCCVSVIIMSLYGFININGSLLNDGDKKHIDKRVIEYNIKHSLEFYK